jgi:hypothetical protein
MQAWKSSHKPFAAGIVTAADGVCAAGWKSNKNFQLHTLDFQTSSRNNREDRVARSASATSGRPEEFLMNAVPVTATIAVELEVSRYEEYPDNMVQVWGHVGDYEISVWLPSNDPRLRNVLRPKSRRRRNNQVQE